MNDVRKMIYGTIIGFFIFLGFWFSIVYVSACGFTVTCRQATPLIIRTPIPTLIPAVRFVSQTRAETEFDKCRVSATDLIGAWVTAGYSETEAFPFTDLDGQPCEGTLTADIRQLFVENSIWFPGSIGCISCHNSNFSDRSAGLDLTTYEALLMGSRRVAGSTSTGTDILGGGDWEKSRLHEVLVSQQLVPEGHSADTPASELIVYAGKRVAQEEVIATPTP